MSLVNKPGLDFPVPLCHGKKDGFLSLCPFLLCPILSLRMGQTVKILYRPVPQPVPDFDRLSRPILSLIKILSLFSCPFVPGQ